MGELLVVIDKLEAVAKSFSGNYAVYAEHFDSGEVVEYGNSHGQFETASVMKLPVLVEALRQCQGGTLRLDQLISYEASDFVEGSGVLQHLSFGIRLPLHDVLTLMIIVSDNVATNMVIRTVGLKPINQLCFDAGLQKTEVRRNISFDATDPLGLSSPRDMVTLLKLLHDHRVLDDTYSELALDILSRQQYNTMLTRALPYSLLDDNDEEAPLVRVMSKSGSLKGIRNDVGMVSTPWGTYGIAIMSENSLDQRFHVDTEAHVVLPRVSRLLFDHFIGDAWKKSQA